MWDPTFVPVIIITWETHVKLHPVMVLIQHLPIFVRDMVSASSLTNACVILTVAVVTVNLKTIAYPPIVMVAVVGGQESVSVLLGIPVRIALITIVSVLDGTIHLFVVVTEGVWG